VLGVPQVAGVRCYDDGWIATEKDSSAAKSKYSQAWETTEAIRRIGSGRAHEWLVRTRGLGTDPGGEMTNLVRRSSV
jgi:hypothetical protein